MILSGELIRYRCAKSHAIIMSGGGEPGNEATCHTHNVYIIYIYNCERNLMCSKRSDKNIACRGEGRHLTKNVIKHSCYIS